eukprot:scaffold1463_cov201-Alexandrium_tamarense.AAC.6
MPRIYANPPPLPQNLSERMQQSIDRKTGCCVYHPQIRLCELMEDRDKWVVRRKICFQCGSRPGSVVDKRHHMPGKAIKNPSCRGLDREKSTRSSRGLDREKSSRSSRGLDNSSRSGRSSRSSLSSRDS